jgi:ribonuclease VapC
VIAVDTSALMAIALDEPAAGPCMDALQAADELLISAGTVAEAMIVAGRRNVSPEVASLIDGLGFTVVPLTLSAARQVAQAYDKWGKGIHAAALNFGDCFAYALARDAGCPLLFVGDDFSKTDVRAAL